MKTKQQLIDEFEPIFLEWAALNRKDSEVAKVLLCYLRPLVDKMAETELMLNKLLRKKAKL